jgi:hypothetical protein
MTSILPLCILVLSFLLSSIDGNALVPSHGKRFFSFFFFLNDVILFYFINQIRLITFIRFGIVWRDTLRGRCGCNRRPSPRKLHLESPYGQRSYSRLFFGWWWTFRTNSGIYYGKNFERQELINAVFISAIKSLVL